MSQVIRSTLLVHRDIAHLGMKYWQQFKPRHSKDLAVGIQARDLRLADLLRYALMGPTDYVEGAINDAVVQDQTFSATTQSTTATRPRSYD